LTRKIRQNQQSSKIVFKTAEQLLEEQEKLAGFSEPAPDFWARTETDDDIHGDDSLQNDQL
jgi:hypothetical protein